MLMIITALYSDIEKINFWGKYTISTDQSHGMMTH